jgi:putative ABC transport system permease protein
LQRLYGEEKHLCPFSLLLFPNNMPIQPPRLADRLLEWFCASHLLEEVQGDLHERFLRDVDLFGEKFARRRYFWSVLAFLRPFAMKEKKNNDYSNPLLQMNMIRNYFKIAFRNLAKNMRFSMINVTGMAVGMACTLLIFMIIKHETEYDLDQSKRDRIYRVETNNIKEGQNYPGTYTGMFNAVANDVPEAEQSVPVLQMHGSTFSEASSDNRFKETFVYTTGDLFKVLDYQWLGGKAESALTQPNTVVLTRKYAEKYFGKADVVGQTLRLDNKQDLQVTGVLENYSSATSFPFDILISLQTVKSLNPDMDLNRWNGWNDNSQVYILLKQGIKPEQLTRRMSDIVVKYLGKEALADKAFTLRPLTGVHYTPNLSGRSANISMLTTLSFIGLLVLLISCFNFINLSTAQAFKRAKEVGIRKVVGSNRISLVNQFLTEAGLISFSAVVLAGLISWLLLPSVASILDVPLSVSDLFTWQTAFFALALTFITTLMAGLYPALRMSGMAPILALKKNSLKSGKQWVPLRETLVVMQFAASLVLISCAFLINQQLSLFQNADLGFNKNAIITTGLPDNSPAKLRTLRNQLTDIPQVRNVSFSLNSASSESNWMQGMEVRGGAETVQIKTQMKLVDENFFSTYGIQLLAGQWLKNSDTLHKVIANQIFLDRMGGMSPQEAIGQKIFYGDGPESATIVGVVKNFNVNSLHQKIDPTLMEVVPQHFYQAGIKLDNKSLDAETIQATIAQVKKVWTSTFPGQVFDYKFLDEELRQAYKSEQRTAQLIEAATFMAVLIACLGLFGLATFMAEQRTKEIGVRKVLGASVGKILTLLSKDFLKLVLIAIVFATPLTWYIMNQWLQNFEFKIQISWWVFGITGLTMMVIALLTVSFQSLKAAMMNPVKSLRSE